jgi:hypothetical protein
MTMNVEVIKANTYEVSNSEKKLNVLYTPKDPRGVSPNLKIKDMDKEYSFKGDEITENKVQELDLITVDISTHQPGAPLVCLSLLVPKVNLKDPQDVESLTTFCIKTTRKSGSIPPEYHIGQEDSYEIIELTGKAKLLLL